MARVWKPRVERPRWVSETVLYPLRFYRLRVALRRLLGEPRVVELYVMVDRVRAKGFVADGYPETVEMTGVEIPARAGDEASERIARRTALYWAMRKYRIGLAPEIEVLDTLDVYKAFWIVEEPGGRRVIVDSVTGAEEEA